MRCVFWDVSDVLSKYHLLYTEWRIDHLVLPFFRKQWVFSDLCPARYRLYLSKSQECLLLVPSVMRPQRGDEKCKLIEINDWFIGRLIVLSTAEVSFEWNGWMVGIWKEVVFLLVATVKVFPFKDWGKPGENKHTLLIFEPVSKIPLLLCIIVKRVTSLLSHVADVPNKWLLHAESNFLHAGTVPDDLWLMVPSDVEVVQV